MKEEEKPTREREEEEGGKDYLETDIDELYELIKKNGLIKVKIAAKKFKVDEERIEEWGRILEQHNLAILHYPPFGDPVMILEKFKPKAVLKSKKVDVKNKKALLVNIVIILGFVIFILLYTGWLSMASIPDLSNISDIDVLDIFAQNQIYLVLVLIIIIVVLLIVTMKKMVKKKGRGDGEKEGKHEKKRREKRGKGKNRKL